MTDAAANPADTAVGTVAKPELAAPPKPDALARLSANLARVIRGKPESLRLVLTGLLAEGHVLLEDVPGVGKTTLAKALARSIDGVFRRIQFTPDLLPADITGSSYFDPREGAFRFRDGPVFANVLLADEINRTAPRTQSALLEVMSERQVTVEGVCRDLTEPFFVIATQNPADFQGTYPLPEAQLDRFTLQVALGYPDREAELEILFGQNERHPLDTLLPVVSCADVVGLQNRVRAIRFDRAIAEYVARLAEESRRDSRLRLAVSPRGSLALFRTAQARALLDGRDHVLPEDVRSLAVPVLAHRILLDTKSRFGGLRPARVVEEYLERTPLPR